MATAVLFMGWDRPMPGHTKDAYKWLTTDGVSFLRKHEGKAFERMELIGLTPHGGDMNGCVILFGDRSKLDELRRTDEFESFAFQMGEQFDHFGVVPGVNWDGIQAVMKRQQWS